MNVELTVQSAAEYNRLRSGQMTPAMAAVYLREGQITLRSFQEVLRELYPAPDLPARLLEAVQSGDPDLDPESAARRVRNWLSGQNRPASREDIFRIAFALGLPLEGADTLLGLCTGYGVHYREGREAVCAWFLHRGGSYAEAMAFYDTLPPVPHPAQLPPGGATHITRELRDDFLQARTLEEFRARYRSSLERMGALHARAFTYFQKYLALLVRPNPAWSWVKEPDYSIETVMEKYLSLHMPSGRNRKGYSVVQKLIKRDWPNATALKNIRLGKKDVPRKLLLLLYIVTENGLAENNLSLQERLEDHWWNVNAILSDCGMSPLDPRNAADWLVLYALAAVDEPMSQRMEEVIQLIFSDLQ